LFELALLGLGVIRLSDIIVGPAIRSGRLVPILTDVHQPEPLPLHAVYLPIRHRPPKVGAMIDFLVEKFTSVPWRMPHAVADTGPAPRAKGVRRRGL
jgi:DNA-binding transcriptional LysR family regulator